LYFFCYIFAKYELNRLQYWEFVNLMYKNGLYFQKFNKIG